MRSISELVKNNELLILDGSMGVRAISEGIDQNRIQAANIEHPEVIQKIQRSYLEAGSMALLTNTFNLTEETVQSSGFTMEEIIKAAFDNARAAAEGFPDTYILFDMSPSGYSFHNEDGLFPYEKCYALYSRQVRIAKEFSPDCVFIETIGMSDEIKAAINAVRDNSELPIMTSMAFDASGKSWCGEDLKKYAGVVNELKPLAAGLNCFITPREMLPLIKEFRELSTQPVLAKPNRGQPVHNGETTTYEMSPEDYAEELYEVFLDGVRILGGCCGTDEKCLSRFTEKVRA